MTYYLLFDKKFKIVPIDEFKRSIDLFIELGSVVYYQYNFWGYEIFVDSLINKRGFVLYD